MLALSVDGLGGRENMECEDVQASLLDLVIKWNGNDYDVKSLNIDSDVKTLKEEIFKCTGVRPERQKLINLRVSGQYKISFISISSSTSNFICGAKRCWLGKIL